MKAATIYDVAKAAGVSHQTVTRYLHGYEGIRQDTRSRVENALAQLDYRPNRAARQLRLRTSNRIAVLTDRIGEGGPALIVRGVTEFIQSQGFVSDIIAVDGSDPSSVDAAIDLALDNQVAGILATAQTELVLRQLRARPLEIPIVIDAQLTDDANEELIGHIAGRLAAEHLIDLGHRRIGYVGGPDGWFVSRDRAEGFIDTVQRSGGEIVWTHEGDWSGEAGYAAWNASSRARRSVTAVAAANDSMAMGVMAAAVDEGLRIPSDVSVIGIDGRDEARFVRPALSTVLLDFEREGAALAAQLIGQVRSADQRDAGVTSPGAVSNSSPRLVVRDSTSMPLRHDQA